MRKVYPIVMVAIATIASIIVYPKLPERVPTHFDIRGNPNAYGPRWVATFLFPVVILALWGLMRGLPKIDPRHAVIVGLRDVDQMEKPHVRDSGVRAFTMRDIDERGLRSVMDDAIRVASEGTAGFILSLDMDFVDPRDAPGVGTAVRGGVTYREAHLAMEMICDSGGMVAMEVVEVNPVIDEANRTGDLAVELVMSGLGKRIL